MGRIISKVVVRCHFMSRRRSMQFVFSFLPIAVFFLMVVLLVLRRPIGRRNTETTVPAAAATTMPAVTGERARSFAEDTWAECLDEQDAEMVLVAILTIPGILNEQPTELPIRRHRLLNDAGHLILPPGNYGMLNADGQRGYIGQSINVQPNLLRGSDVGISVNIFVYWGLDGKRGQISQVLLVPAGRDSTFA